MSDLDAYRPSFDPNPTLEAATQGLDLGLDLGSELFAQSPLEPADLGHIPSEVDSVMMESADASSAPVGANLGLSTALDPSQDGWWETVDLPGSLQIDRIPHAADVSLHSSSTLDESSRDRPAPRSPESPLTLLQLQADNQALRDRLAGLEAAHATTRAEVQQATQAAAVADLAKTQLSQELEEAFQATQRQQILVQTLTEQLEASQERIGQIERDCAAIQQRCSEQMQLRTEAEEVCRDLRNRLHRQQQQTLQFKVALEKCIEMPSPANQSHRQLQENRQDHCRALDVVHPEAVTEGLVRVQPTPVQPWSAPTNGPSSLQVNPAEAMLVPPTHQIPPTHTLAKLVSVGSVQLEAADLSGSELEPANLELSEFASECFPVAQSPEAEPGTEAAIAEIPGVVAQAQPGSEVQVLEVQQGAIHSPELPSPALQVSPSTELQWADQLQVTDLQGVDPQGFDPQSENLPHAPQPAAPDQSDPTIPEYVFPAIAASPAAATVAPTNQVFSNLQDAVAAALESQAKMLEDSREGSSFPAPALKNSAPKRKTLASIDLPCFPRKAPASVY